VEGLSQNEQCGSFGGAERRANIRYPCRLCVSWKTLDPPLRRGESTIGTLNISSKGLLFSTAEKFERGSILEVTLDWPVRLNQQVALKLVITGHVIRSADGCTAVRINHYEFRTRGQGISTVHEVPVRPLSASAS
jgi:hypothetical protein